MNLRINRMMVQGLKSASFLSQQKGRGSKGWETSQRGEESPKGRRGGEETSSINGARHQTFLSARSQPQASSWALTHPSLPQPPEYHGNIHSPGARGRKGVIFIGIVTFSERLTKLNARRAPMEPGCLGLCFPI